MDAGLPGAPLARQAEFGLHAAALLPRRRSATKVLAQYSGWEVVLETGKGKGPLAVVPRVKFRQTPPPPVQLEGLSGTAEGVAVAKELKGFPFTTRNQASVAVGFPRVRTKVGLSLDQPPQSAEETALPTGALSLEQRVGPARGTLRVRSTGDWDVSADAEVEELGGTVRSTLRSDLDWSMALEKGFHLDRGVNAAMTYGATQDGMFVKGQLDGSATPVKKRDLKALYRPLRKGGVLLTSRGDMAQVDLSFAELSVAVLPDVEGEGAEAAAGAWHRKRYRSWDAVLDTLPAHARRAVGRAARREFVEPERHRALAGAFSDTRLHLGDRVADELNVHPNTWSHSAVVKFALERIGSNSCHHMRNLEFGRWANMLTDIARYMLRGAEGNLQYLDHSAAVKKGMKCRNDRVSRHEQVIYPPFILASTSASVTYSALDRSDFNLGRAVELTEVVNFIILVLGADGAMSNIRLFAWMLSKVVECNSRARREGRGLLLLLMTVCFSHVLNRSVVLTFGHTKIIPAIYNTAFCFRYTPRLNKLLRAIERKIAADLMEGGFVLGEPDPSDQQHAMAILSAVICRPMRTRGRGASADPARDEDVLRARLDTMMSLFNGDIRSRRVSHVCAGCCAGAGDCASKMAVAAVTETFVDSLSTTLPSTSKWYTAEPAMIPQVGLTLLCGILPQLAVGTIEQLDENDEDELRRSCAMKVNKAKSSLTDPQHWQDITAAFWGAEPVDKLDATLQHLDESGHALEDAAREDGCVAVCQKELFDRAMSSPGLSVCSQSGSWLAKSIIVLRRSVLVWWNAEWTSPTFGDAIMRPPCGMVAGRTIASSTLRLVGGISTIHRGRNFHMIIAAAAGSKIRDRPSMRPQLAVPCRSGPGTFIPLSRLVHHFAPEPGVDCVVFQRAAFVRVMSISAIVWSRVVIPMTEPPLVFSRLSDPKCSDLDRGALWHDFSRRPKCCLDWGFSRPMREASVDFAAFEAAACGMSRRAGATNMGLERLLNLITKSAPSQVRRPVAERVVYAGALTQFQQRYLQVGFQDRRGHEKRADLVRRGVPIAATAKSRSAGSGSRVHVSYGNMLLAQWLADHPEATEREIREQQSKCMSAWGKVSLREQLRFLAERGPSDAERALPQSGAHRAAASGDDSDRPIIAI
ncbi:unnamed protein product [Prorocentrum cordatum]|uniref:Uncharacterized protein n=1 Tax=Prorocentrum cordatum TaxID=2364126 RepID=A0ABN9VLJ5_9DINO|nr:unnamed protein product [Polarella glacialis]